MNNHSDNTIAYISTLAIEFAQKYISDQAFCALLRHQDEIAQGDPVKASEVQSKINAVLYRFIKDKNASHLLFPQVRVTFSLMRAKMLGNLTEIESPESEKFIQEQLEKYPNFYKAA